MVLRCALGRLESPDSGVRMDVRASINPRAPPWRIVNEYGVAAPVKSGGAPTPRTEESSTRHAKSEPDRDADNDARSIVGHHQVAWIHGHDGYIRSAAYDNLAIGPQVPVIRGLLALPLHLSLIHI